MRGFYLGVLFAFLIQCSNPDARQDCNAYAGWEALAERSSSHIILFGEMHGTNESPEAVANFLCELVNSDTSIRFGIEAAYNQSTALNDAVDLPIVDQELTDAAPRMWSVPDGRSSIAVLSLLNKLAFWKSTGADIEIFAFDSTFQGRDAGLSRSEVMAREVDHAARGFSGAVVVLTGDYHINLNPLDSSSRGGSMASEVRERPVLAMKMAHEGGTAYVTASFDGGQPIIGESSFSKNHGQQSEIRSFQLSDVDPRKGYYFTGPITASPPAYPELVKE